MTVPHPRRRRRRLWRSRRSLLAVAVVCLAALVCIDCLNLTQSQEWTDLSRAPHLAAVRKATDGKAPGPVKRADVNPIAAILPASLVVWMVWFLWGVVLGLAVALMARPRFRRRMRAPPALPVQQLIATCPNRRSCHVIPQSGSVAGPVIV